jgi:23S rRNA pseudoU1915 N3-methylase RlmH
MGNISSMNLSNLSNSLLSIKKINFEEMNSSIINTNNIIINTLENDNQKCLIFGTISIEEEIQILNEYLNTNKNIKIIIYGKNNNDDKLFLKYEQLANLGFTNVSLYIGGLFEWLLLQEIYGEDNFPTTTSEIDLLNYK